MKEYKGAENEEQGSKMEVDEAAPGMQTSSNDTDGGFTQCEVEERQEACRSPRPKKKSDTCGIIRNAGLRA